MNKLAPNLKEQKEWKKNAGKERLGKEDYICSNLIHYSYAVAS